MSIDFYLGLNKPDEKKEITLKSALSDVVFEPRTVYEGQHKKLYTFNDSLQALRERGYERHPRPAEAFDLICRGLEGRLSPEQQAIADDMMNSYGEWLSMAMLRKGNLLHCYLDPENLLWDKKEWRYVVQGGKIKHAREEVYSISSFPDCFTPKTMNEINPTLVEKLWSRPYAILPEKIRQNALMWIPPESVLWLMSRGGYYKWYDVGTGYCKVSRGVMPQA